MEDFRKSLEIFLKNKHEDLIISYDCILKNDKDLYINTYLSNIKLAIQMNDISLDLQLERVRKLKIFFQIDTIIYDNSEDFFTKLDSVLWKRKVLISKNYDEYKLKKLLENIKNVDEDLIKKQFKWFKVGEKHSITLKSIYKYIGYDDIKEAKSEVLLLVDENNYRIGDSVSLNYYGLKELIWKTSQTKRKNEFIQYSIEIEKYANMVNDEICKMMKDQIEDTLPLDNYDICKNHFCEDKVLPPELESKFSYNDGDCVLYKLYYNSKVKTKMSKSTIIEHIIIDLNKSEKEAKLIYKEIVEKLELGPRTLAISCVEWK